MGDPSTLGNQELVEKEEWVVKYEDIEQMKATSINKQIKAIKKEECVR